MKAYSIFDDFGREPATLLINAGVDLTIHPFGKPRPTKEEMIDILENYDCIIIGTSQKISRDMFQRVSSPKIIATASVGLDHIHVPSKKQKYITIINTPKANAQSVAEYTIGCALSCCKRLVEGNSLYMEGKSNKALSRRPEDLFGKTLGVIGAGNIAMCIIQYAKLLGMNVLCWTSHPEKHESIVKLGVAFTDLEELIKVADVISVNLPSNEGTKGFVSSELVALMKKDAIFISISRRDILDIEALFNKAELNKNFYVCLDMDVVEDVVQSIPRCENIQITPHVAGGTIETRKRMFLEIAQQIIESL